MRKITWLVACVIASLALAAGPAFAQSATDDAYSSLAGSQQGGGGNPVVVSSSGDEGSLPFTGLELALVAAAGAGLLGVGFTARRASRVREDTP